MITRDMIIADILDQYPEAQKIFERFGVRCFG